MEGDINQIKQKIKRELADFLGVDQSDIEDDSVLSEDLHMGASQLTDFMEIIKTAGFDTNLDLTEIETFSDLVESIASHE